MDNYTHLHNMYEHARKVNQERFALGSKKKLMQNIEKKFKTAMIGTLARCEESLGFLWGCNSDKSLTKDQREFKEIWEQLRTNILNHCNSQARAAMEEISQYNITWQKYQTNFIIKKDKGGNVL